jgi:hypothetical protein
MALPATSTLTRWGWCDMGNLKETGVSEVSLSETSSHTPQLLKFDPFGTKQPRFSRNTA